MTFQEIQNGINADVTGVYRSGFPLEVFPQKMQTLVLDLARQENYIVEYAASSLLVAATTAVGNARHLNLKGLWNLSPLFYMILVGRLGAGKTPPLQFAFKPLVEIDRQAASEYKDAHERWAVEKEAYERAKKNGETVGEAPAEPRLKRTILTDFTYEVMMRIHGDNPRGIVIQYDEIIGLFKSANRYNGSPIMEAILSIFSNASYHMSRCGMDQTLDIEHPCVSIVGTTQTKLVGKLFELGLIENGFIDRFVFVYPLNVTIPKWSLEDAEVAPLDLLDKWREIILRLCSLEYGIAPDGVGIEPVILHFTREAREAFFIWHNNNVDAQNAIDDENLVNTRMAKWDYLTARFALMLQLLHWACGETDSQDVEKKAVEGAIRLTDYYEDCFLRIQAIVGDDGAKSKIRTLYLMLPDKFTKEEAISLSKGFLGASSVNHMLPEMVRLGWLKKEGRSVYCKIID